VEAAGGEVAFAARGRRYGALLAVNHGKAVEGATSATLGDVVAAALRAAHGVHVLPELTLTRQTRAARALGDTANSARLLRGTYFGAQEKSVVQLASSQRSAAGSPWGSWCYACPLRRPTDERGLFAVSRGVSRSSARMLHGYRSIVGASPAAREAAARKLGRGPPTTLRVARCNTAEPERARRRARRLGEAGRAWPAPRATSTRVWLAGERVRWGHQLRQPQVAVELRCSLPPRVAPRRRTQRLGERRRRQPRGAPRARGGRNLSRHEPRRVCSPPKPLRSTAEDSCA
jgi:hypothetical protein